MNLLQHPELLDRLASSYALGTLRGGARRRFEAMAREQAPVRAAALIWQSRLASLNELQPQAQPRHGRTQRRAVVRRRAPHSQEGILQHVLGQLALGNHAQCQAVELAGALFIQGFECGLVLVGDAVQQDDEQGVVVVRRHTAIVCHARYHSRMLRLAHKAA